MLVKSSHPVVKNFSPAKYQQRGDLKRDQIGYVMSRSELKDFAACPLEWVIGKEEEEEETKAQRYGSLLDCLLTTPDLYEYRYEVTPETYQSRGMKCPICGSVTDSKKCSKCKVDREPCMVEKPWTLQATECKEWAARIQAEEKTPIKPVELNSANRAIGWMKERPDIMALVENSDKQVYFRVEWHDEETGIIVPVVGLIDLAPHDSRELVDIKTTKDLTHRGFSRQIAENAYDIQGAIYIDGYNLSTGENRDVFRHVLSKNISPFLPASRPMSEEFLQLGRDKYKRLLASYSQCLKTNHWPGPDEWEDGQPLTTLNVSEPQIWML